MDHSLIAFSASLLAANTPGAAAPPATIEVSKWDACLGGPNHDIATLSCIPIVAQNIINFLAIFAGVVAVFFLIFAGFKFVTSQGDPEKVAAARRTMVFVLWGSLIVATSFLILMLISQFTGVSSIAPKP